MLKLMFLPNRRTPGCPSHLDTDKSAARIIARPAPGGKHEATTEFKGFGESPAPEPPCPSRWDLRCVDPHRRTTCTGLAVGMSAGDQVVLGEAGGATDSCR